MSSKKTARGEKSPTEEEKLHFANYSSITGTLRAWLVGYGIGGPVLFATNVDLSKRMAASPHAKEIVFAFLLGVALQILLVFINKWAAWVIYYGTGDPDYQKTRMYKFWHFINGQAWIDFFIDSFSIISFFFATWGALGVFLT